MQEKASNNTAKINSIEDRLQQIHESNLNKYSGDELKKKYLESRSNIDIVKKLNVDFRKEFKGVLLYNYGYKFDFKRIVEAIDFANFHIVHNYKVHNSKYHLKFNDFINLNEQTYEACPFLLWDLIGRCLKRAYRESDKYKNNKSDKRMHYVEGRAIGVLMGDIHKKLLIPSIDKYNRFFAIMSNTAGWCYVKPLEENIERNNKTPSYVRIKYAYCKQSLYLRRNEDIKYFHKDVSIKAVIPTKDNVMILGNDKDYNIIVRKTIDRKDIKENLEKRTPVLT